MPSPLHPAGTLVAVASGEIWKTGRYVGPAGDGLHEVAGADGAVKAAAEAIRGPGAVYIRADGSAAEPMSFSEAVETVHELASGEQPDVNDDPDNRELTELLAWQERALATVSDLVVNHHENLDDSFTPPVAVRESWPESTVGCDRGLDPDEVVPALRICLELGENGIEDERRADEEQLEAIRRAQQACYLVRELIGRHGREIAAKITVVKGVGGPA